MYHSLEYHSLERSTYPYVLDITVVKEHDSIVAELASASRRSLPLRTSVMFYTRHFVHRTGLDVYFPVPHSLLPFPTFRWPSNNR